MQGSERNPLSDGVEMWLGGGGELGALIRQHDWSTTDLGVTERWPQSLKTTLGILLNSRYPMFVFWGPQLLKIYNDAYRPILGHKHPWALGRPGTEVWPEIWKDIKPLVDRALAGDPTWSDDLLLFMERNGFPEEVYFTFSYSPVPDESGGIGGMFCACTETTGKVLGERRLRTLRDLASAPAEAQTVMQACALSARVLDTNRADLPFALLYLSHDGHTAHLMAQSGVEPGETFSPVTIALADPDAVWPLGQVAETRAGIHVSTLSNSIGTASVGPWPEPPSAAMVLPLVDRSVERCVGALVLGISSRRPFDTDYREWFELVAGQISASISNVRAAEEERKRAQALAEIDRAKTTFFSNVSHELRTPLTLMLGPLEQAIDPASGSLNARQREELATAQRNALRLQKLVNALLDFSRLEAGRLEASYEAVDLGAFTTELASVFRSAIETAGLRLTIDCPTLPAPVFVDREMWEKIVLNLLSNALKFTFEGEVAVRLTWRGEHVELEVRDTGVGISPTDLPRVFERFHRIRNTRARTHEGTGIGLALVQELVRLHSGTITVESSVDRGTTFTVSIPTGVEHFPADRVSRASAGASTAVATVAYLHEVAGWVSDRFTTAVDEETSLRPSYPIGASPVAERERIVIADDNADMREYLQRLLGANWEVEAFADGEAALHGIRQRRPSLVLSDVMMPGLDGFELLRAIRDDERTRDLPFVLLSARAGEEARVEGMQAGADDYLAKPFSARELVARVGAHLEIARIRRDADRKLRESEARFRTMADHAPVMVWVTEPDGSCSYLNQSWYELTGQTPATGLGFGWLEATHPDDHAETERIFMAANERRQAFRLEYRLRRKDGEYRWVIDSASPRFGPDGRFEGYIGSVIDITERKQMEEALRSNEERYRAVVESQAEMVCRFRPDGTILFVNGAYAQVREVPADALLGTNFWSFVAAEERAQVRALLDTLRPDAPEIRIENHFETAAGRRWTLWTNRALSFDTDGAATEVQSVGIDITDRKRREAHAAFLASLSDDFANSYSVDEIMQLVAVRLGTHLNVSRCLLAEIDFSGDRGTIVHDWSDEGAASIAGDYRLSDFIAGEVCALLSSGRQLVVDDTARDARTMPHQASYARLDAAASVTTPQMNEGRWTTSLTVHSRTPRHWNADELELLRDVSSRLWLRIDRARAEQRLRESEAQLRRTGEIKDEFLATLSHELRTPLNAMLGWSHMLRTGALTKDVEARAFDSLERNAKAQAQLVDDLLDMSRIVSGRLQIKNEPVDLVTIVASAADTVRPAADSKGVALEVANERAHTLRVSGDPGRLRQIAWNLLSNAVKFTPSGGRVQVALQRVGENVELVVRDNGEGIEADFLPFVFDRFRQADGKATRRHGGLGLGLAIVRHMTEAHGGTVAAASDGRGKGSTFTIRFPAIAAVAEVSQRTRATRSRAGRLLRGTRILAVDDEADARELVSTVLEAAGGDVTTVGSAGEALHVLQQDRFDVLLADIGMPDQDGLWLICAVRSAGGTNGRIAAIAVTAYASLMERERALEAGYNWHLPKPVEPDQLIAAVSQASAATARSPRRKPRRSELDPSVPVYQPAKKETAEP